MLDLDVASRRRFCARRSPATATMIIGACIAFLHQVPSAALPPPSVDVTAVFGRTAPSVVMVEAKTNQGPTLGSGVVVGKGLVVTNKHVVADSVGFIILRQGSTTWRAEVEAIDEHHDLALLGVVLRRTENFALPAVKRRSLKTVRVGEKVFAIGSPRGLQQSLSDGLVSGIPSDGTTTFVQTTAAISPGSSGGGLFDAKGQLLGITTLYLKDSQSLNFAVPVDAVELLESKSKTSPTLSNTYAFTAPDSQAAEVVGSASAPQPSKAIPPVSIAAMRAVILTVSSEGPIAFGGGVSEAWLLKNVTQRLRRSGLAVYASQDEAAKEGFYGLLLGVFVSSMKIEDSVLYPWRVQIDLLDNTDFVDGSNRMVTVWSNGSYGFGGSDVVVDQVSRTVLELVGSLADQAASARQGQLRPRSDAR